MLAINYEKWGQSPEFLRNLALNSEHPRTRERFLALFEISQGKNATQISRETGRNHQTVMGWVHSYNEWGHESLLYRHTGGISPTSRKTAANPSAHQPHQSYSESHASTA